MTIDYAITLGNLGTDGIDYGTFAGETPEAALVAALRDSDSKREHAVTLLSTSATFGQSNGNLNGNGTADRSEWFYVRDVNSARVSIFEAHELADRA